MCWFSLARRVTRDIVMSKVDLAPYLIADMREESVAQIAAVDPARRCGASEEYEMLCRRGLLWS
jgi:hypothetical protein